MATVLHRTTKQLIASVNTPDYPTVDWIVEPNLSAVAGFASKYWTIVGDAVLLKTAPERDAVDAAELSANRDAATAQLDQLEDVLRAFALVLLDELNLHATRTNAILDAVDAASNITTLKTAVALIADVPTRTIAQVRASVRGKLGS